MATKPISSSRLLAFSCQLYRLFLVAYPPHFRDEYGPHMAQVFRDSCRDVVRQGQRLGLLWLWVSTIADLTVTAIHEWFARSPGPVHYLWQIGIGLAAGMVGGFAAGLASRLAMRGVALVGGLRPNFTLEGTFAILAIGLILGMPFGLMYVAARRLIPGVGIWKGASFGVLLFVIFMAPPFLFYREGEALLATPLVTVGLFGPVAMAYGLAVELTVARLSPQSDRLPAQPGSQANVLSTLLWFILFTLLLELGVLGITSILNHAPQYPWAHGLFVRQLGFRLSTVRDANQWLINLFALGYFGLNGLLFWKRSGTWMTRFTALALLLFGGALFNTGAGYYADLADPETLRPFFNLIQVLGVTALLALLYLFPDGRFAPAWSRLIILPWLAFAVVWLVTPLPYQVTFIVTIAFFCSGLLAQVGRYRAASPDERRPLRWPLIGFTIAIVGFSLVTLVILITPDFIVASVEGLAIATTFGPYLLPWLFIPVTIGWAMRRHKLWAT